MVNATDEGLKNAGHVVDEKFKDTDKYLNEKRENVCINYIYLVYVKTIYFP